MRFGIVQAAVLLLLGCVSARRAIADQPRLHHRIDRFILEQAEKQGKQLAEITSDAEFLRRVYLDLTGRIPAADQVRTFLADVTPNKRQLIIDRLLESPEHTRRMQYVFDEMLMRRLPQKHVDLKSWRDYLFQSFRANKPWDELTRELLSADGACKKNRPAARFLLDREVKQEQTIRDLGRAFLGRDLQCAQCHDHPHFDDYRQRHYFGLAAFLNRTYLFKDPKSKQTSLGEKADGVVKFTSVFTGEEGETWPRILDLSEIQDPPKKKKPYLAKPGKNTRGVPSYSRRLQLAEAMTDPRNLDFRRNIANRLWALLMGRGLVHPVDMFHQQNPPSHPELLDLLADDLHEHCYDMRRTMRQILLSETYQRSSVHSNGDHNQSLFNAGSLKPLTSEQLAWSVLQATGMLQTTRQQIVSRLKKEDKEFEQGFDRGARSQLFQAEQALHDALQKDVEAFVEVFASGQQANRFDATAKQALFLINGPILEKWLEPTKGNLVSRLQNLSSAESIAEELFVSVLCRLPTPTETKAVRRFVESFGANRVEGLQELVRATLCCAEFRFNH